MDDRSRSPAKELQAAATGQTCRVWGLGTAVPFVDCRRTGPDRASIPPNLGSCYNSRY